MTVQEAADALGVTTRRVQQLVRRGALHAHGVGARMLAVDRASVERYRRERRPSGRPRRQPEAEPAQSGPDLPAIGALEHAAQQWTRRQFGQAADLVDRASDLLAGVLEALHGLKAANDQHRLLLMLGVRSFNTLRVAQLAVLNGYPLQTIMLARAILEDRLIASWVLAKPEAVPLWLDLKYAKRPLSRQVPTITDQINALPDAEVRDVVWEIYGTLSLFAHPRGLGLSGEHESEGDAWKLMLGPRQDEDHTSGAYYCLLAVVPHMVFIIGLFTGKNPGWASRRTEWERDVTAWLEAENAEVQRLRALVGADNVEGPG